ncbi:MAG: hypothetical protein U0903_11535 [Planctomycetales bacterium]
MKVTTYWLLIFFWLLSALGCAAFTLVFWMAILMAAASGEERCLRDTGMPCNDLIQQMKFSPWQPGGNSVHLFPGSFTNEYHEYPIVRYRVGQIHFFFAKLTYYQIEIHKPNGENFVWAGEGPIRTVTRQPLVWEIVFGGWFFGSLFMFYRTIKRLVAYEKAMIAARRDTESPPPEWIEP